MIPVINRSYNWFLPFVAPKIFLLVLILLVDLVLVDRLLPIRYVNRGKVSRLIYPKVFILFLDCFVPLEIFGINLSVA